MTDYLPKPINKETLRTMLMKYMSIAEALEEKGDNPIHKEAPIADSPYVDIVKLLQLTQHSAERIRKFIDILFSGDKSCRH